MADQFGSVANAGAYMMQSGLRALTERREQDMKREIAMAKLSASGGGGGGGGGGRDPLSRGAAAFSGMRDMLNQYSDEQIALGKRRNELAAINGPLGPGEQEELAKVNARIANNDLSLKMLTSQFGDGQFEVTRVTPDGGQMKATFRSAAAYEAWNNTFGSQGQTQEQGKETNESLLTKIFGGQRTGQGQPSGSPQQSSEPMTNYADELGPTKRRDTSLPEGFQESEEETSTSRSDTAELKKELAKLQLQRESTAKGTGYRPNVVVGAPGVGMATEARYRPSDKSRARNVRNLDKEIESLKQKIKAREE